MRFFPVFALAHAALVALLRSELAANHAALGPEYYRAFWWWVVLGIPAFTLVLALYALMIFKPGL